MAYGLVGVKTLLLVLPHQVGIPDMYVIQMLFMENLHIITMSILGH